MKTAWNLVLVIPILALAGCMPLTPAPSTSASAPPSPKVTSTPTASVTPTAAAATDVDPASFLLDGTPGVFDADGFWKGHYGFFTDETRAVRCDLFIFSGDSGGVTCAVTPGNDAGVTYARPPAQCDDSTANPSDGLSLGINFKVFDSGNTGFKGCDVAARVDPALVAITRVLHETETLRVSAGSENYTCTVASGVASCSESTSGATIAFGLTTATFSG